MQEIMMLLISSGVETEAIKSKLIIILNDYEIEQRHTEVSVVHEDDTMKYLKMFLINKRVSGRTERTVTYYKRELERFFGEIKKSPLDVTSDDIKMYLAIKEVRDNVSKVYQNSLMRVISSFYQWMIKEEIIFKNPMNKVEAIKVPKVKKEAFTEAQIEQMRVAIDGEDVRLKCIFELLLSTWCRVSELAQITLKDLSITRDKVLIHGKGSKDRTCYINAKAQIYLERYLSERTDGGMYLFQKCSIAVNKGEKVFSAEVKKRHLKPGEWWKSADLVGEGHIDKATIEAMIRKLGKRAGVEKAHPHRFRRTGATFALRRGMPIEQVSKLLGHESIETTQIYLDISEQELENAHRKYV